MRSFKPPTRVAGAQALVYDMVDMPPFDGTWADRRFTFETIPGEPQTSLNARPSNIPRNAQLSSTDDGDDWRSDSDSGYDNETDDDLFPWGVMHTNGNRWAMQRSMRDARESVDASEMVIHLLVVLNFALILYIVFRAK